jgi:hypothetical protein
MKLKPIVERLNVIAFFLVSLFKALISLLRNSFYTQLLKAKYQVSINDSADLTVKIVFASDLVPCEFIVGALIVGYGQNWLTVFALIVNGILLVEVTTSG